MRIGLLLTIVLIAAESLPTSVAQSQSSQPIDPTAQSPVLVPFDFHRTSTVIKFVGNCRHGETQATHPQERRPCWFC